MIYVWTQEPSMDFQPILIEEIEENVEDRALNKEREDYNDEILVQEDETLVEDVPNEDIVPTPKEQINLEPEEPRTRGET